MPVRSWALLYARMAADPLRAVIYIAASPAEAIRWQTACLRYCEARGYQVAALLIDPAGGRWCEVLGLLTIGAADVVVIASRDHLPADRVPRIEAITEQAPRLAPRTRRPRRARSLDAFAGYMIGNALTASQVSWFATWV